MLKLDQLSLNFLYFFDAYLYSCVILYFLALLNGKAALLIYLIPFVNEKNIHINKRKQDRMKFKKHIGNLQFRHQNLPFQVLYLFFLIFPSNKLA